MQNNQIKRNGCFNRKFNMTVVVQDGYRDVTVNEGMSTSGIIGMVGSTRIRVPNFIKQPFRMSTDCKYDRKMIDEGCEGCKHKQESK